MLTIGASLKLSARLGRDETIVQLDVADQMCPTLAANWVVVTLASPTANEQLLLTECLIQGPFKAFQAQRGYNGTKPLSWDAGTCGCITSLIPIPNCNPGPDAAKVFECGYPLDGVSAACGVKIDRTLPHAPVIKLDPGPALVPGDYCGLKVSECGLITEIPPNWPASCLPVFDPCGDCGPGGGGASFASEVTYVPRLGAVFAVGDDVQDAIDQLDAAIADCCESTVEVSADFPIAATGPMTARVISHETSPLPAGTYDNITVDDWGHVLNIAPTPAPVEWDHEPAVPSPNMIITQDAGTSTYYYRVAAASNSLCGCVQLADPSDAVDDPPTEPNAVIRAGDIRWIVGQLVPPGANPCAAPVAMTVSDPDEVLICKAGATNKIAFDNFADDVGGIAASCEFKLQLGTPTVTYSRNMSYVNNPTTGVFVFNLPKPVKAPYHVSVTLQPPASSAHAGEYFVVVLNDTTFELYLRTVANAPTNLFTVLTMSVARIR